MHHLAILLPHGDNFNRVNKSKTKSEYYGICDDCGFDADEYERISIGFIQPHMLLLVNVQRLPKVSTRQPRTMYRYPVYMF